MKDEEIDKVVDKLLDEQVDEYPEQCYDCGRRKKDGEKGWKSVKRDLDPADAEVGPDPDIQTVAVCPECANK